VSVTIDRIFILDLPPGNELSATLHPPEARSEGETISLRTSIALDSGSSIHIFKDGFLLTDFASDDSQSIRVRTTDSKFKVNEIGRLCDGLHALPLTYDGYYYYPNGVANILSLAIIAKTKRVLLWIQPSTMHFIYSMKTARTFASQERLTVLLKWT
jgi:hypothetical protein